MNLLRSFIPTLLVLLLPCAWVLSTPAQAHAQAKGASPPPARVERDAIKAAASDLYERGAKAMDEQRWDDCRASFLAAWNIDRYYQIAGNLAACEAKLGRYADAAEHIAFALREMPDTAPQERRALAQKLMGEVRAKVAEVTIRSNKTGAEISLDDRVVGRSPLATAIFVEPGAHTVEAKLDGAVARTKVNATGGGTHEAVLTLLDPAPPDTGGPRTELWATGAGVAGAALLAGGILIGVAEAKKSEAERLRSDLLASGGGKACAPPDADARCDDLTSALSTRKTLGNAGVWTLIGGGAIAASTVVYVLVMRKHEPPPVQATAFVGAHGGGAALHLSF